MCTDQSTSPDYDTVLKYHFGKSDSHPDKQYSSSSLKVSHVYILKYV